MDSQGEKEGLIIAAQDQALNTRYYNERWPHK